MKFHAHPVNTSTPINRSAKTANKTVKNVLLTQAVINALTLMYYLLTATVPLLTITEHVLTLAVLPGSMQMRIIFAIIVLILAKHVMVVLQVVLVAMKMAHKIFFKMIGVCPLAQVTIFKSGIHATLIMLK